MNRHYTTDFALETGETDATLEAEFKAAGLEFIKQEPSQGWPTYTLVGPEEAILAYLTAQGFEPTGPNDTWEWDA